MKLQELFEAKHSDEDKVKAEYNKQSTAGIDVDDDAKHIAKETGVKKRKVKKTLKKMAESASCENEEEGIRGVYARANKKPENKNFVLGGKGKKSKKVSAPDRKTALKDNPGYTSCVRYD